MKHIALHGTARTKGRKSLTKSIRREGQVPCNLYGNGVENVLFSVDARDLKALTHTPNSYIVDLDIDGKNYLAILHELQFHPVTDNTIHADFLAISADKPVTINVPLNIFGNCAGVKAGGKLLIEARKLRVCGLPDQIPDVLDIDITNLKLGKQITAGDLSYEGIQYRYMAPGVFTDTQLAYVEEHLRILSGFYGLLRPFDGVTPYRLEMQARLSVDGTRDLYAFWGSSIADALGEETDCLLDLASREYGRCLDHRPAGLRVIRCVFGQRVGGKIVEKATPCKMARGEMVRYLAEHSAVRPEEAQGFDRMGFRFSQEESGSDCYVFLKEDV